VKLRRAQPVNAVIKTDISDIYRGYIACLNKQEWPRLEQFVYHEVYYNAQQIGLTGHRKMLEKDFYKAYMFEYQAPDCYGLRCAFRCIKLLVDGRICGLA
jgi:predicted ester cyclase